MAVSSGMPVRHRLCLQAGTTITPTLNGRDMPAENYLLKNQNQCNVFRCLSDDL